MESVHNCDIDFSRRHLSPTECCFCRGPLHDPVTLKCLHHCCQSCLESSSAGTQASRSTVMCPLCFDVTDAKAVVQNSVVCTFERMSALSSDSACCSTCDEAGVSAEFWCADCFKALCESCYSWHSRFHSRHRSAELDVARTWSLSQHMPAARCVVHKRRLEMHCFTCSKPMCLECYESCAAASHDIQSLSCDETQKFLSGVQRTVKGALARLDSALSSLQAKYRSAAAVRATLREARQSGNSMLVRHKRSLQDSVVKTFDRSMNELCVNLHRIWCDHCRVMSRPQSLSDTAKSAASNIALLFVTNLRSTMLICERNLLKAVACSCLSTCGASRRRLVESVKESGSFVVDSSVPLTAQIMLSACLGSTDCRRAAPRAPLLFRQASVTFQTPVACYDLAATGDGRVLLAAAECGLLEYSYSGTLLSCWQPEKRSSELDDLVSCVAALSDGRVVVGVFFAQLVVLVRRGSQTGDSWLEDRRVAVLQSPTYHLAVHDDLLVVTDSRQDELQEWMASHQLQLLRLSSRQLLYRQSREYDIQAIALTALCVVTSSSSPVKRNTGLRPHLVDAYSHHGEFLWRRETSDDEIVMSLCSAENWSRVYMTVRVRGQTSSRLLAIGGADGREIGDVMSTGTHGLQLPWQLSLARGQQRTVLAVLIFDAAAELCRTVTMYEAATSE